MESLVTQNVMHASLCHMNRDGGSGVGSVEQVGGVVERTGRGTGGWGSGETGGQVARQAE